MGTFAGKKRAVFDTFYPRTRGKTKCICYFCLESNNTKTKIRMDRRSFIKSAGAATAAGLVAPSAFSCKSSEPVAGEIVSRQETKVLIIGGGPAGVCAAIASARLGIPTLIVDEGGCLGGMATKGLVSPFMTCFDATGEIQCIQGLFGEIVDRLVSLGGAIHPREVRHTSAFSAWITAGHDHVTPFDAEILKFVLDRMCAEAGVKVLLHASFVRPIQKGGKAAGAVVLTRKGLWEIHADQVIDCTGDGSVAVGAGVPSEFGNAEIGKVQPSTLFFRINSVDSKKLEADVLAHLHEFRKVDGVSYRALHWHVLKAEAAGEWDIARKSVNIYRAVREDEWAVNCTRIANVDATDSESLSAGEAEGRRQVMELMHFFRKYVPGCENAALMCSASTLGIRESLHIKGDYVLTAEDLLSCKVPEDSILLASNSVDVHGRNGAMGTEYKTISGGRWYGVPFRSLLPEGIDNMLIAGRCLSATSDAAGAVRVIPPCMAMGEAAGTAAALSAKAGTSPRSLDPRDLLAQLKKQNVFLG